MLQCVQGDLALQRTHGILNSTDKDLRHSNKIASIVRYNGGPVIDSSCMKYIKDNGALQAGSVQSLSAGNLACLFLFHGISQIWEENKKQLFMRSERKQLNSLIITIVNRYVFPFSSVENILRVIPLFDLSVPSLSTTQ